MNIASKIIYICIGIAVGETTLGDTKFGQALKESGVKVGNFIDDFIKNSTPSPEANTSDKSASLIGQDPTPPAEM